MANEQVKPEVDYPDALVQAACDGSRDAFGKLFQALYPRVHRTVWGMMGDEADAHDVTQDAWIKAWEKRESYNFQSLYSTWVHRIAVNCALDALRKRKRLWARIKGLSTRDNGGKTRNGKEMADASFDLSPSSLVQNKELGQSIQEAINQLPDDHRTVLVLREYEGYSYAEIAKSLDIQPGTVMSRLHHARKKLQERLSKELS
jgi:RNA polymerase sigma-70 factor (ECF subfamily)